MNKPNKPITMDALPPGTVVNLKGKNYPTHPGLLALAHANGLEKIYTELIKAECDGAIVKANANGTRGTYEAHGDASPKNVSKNIATALIRMAETRAIGRALRYYLGIGATTFEELPPEAFQGGPRPKPKPKQKPEQKKEKIDQEILKEDSFFIHKLIKTCESKKITEKELVFIIKKIWNYDSIFSIGRDNAERLERAIQAGPTTADNEWMMTESMVQEGKAESNDLPGKYPWRLLHAFRFGFEGLTNE